MFEYIYLYINIYKFILTFREVFQAQLLICYYFNKKIN